MDPRKSSYTRGRSGGALSWAWVVLGVLCGITLAALGIRDRHLTDVLVGLGIVVLCILLSRAMRQYLARLWAKKNRPQPNLSAPVVIYWRADDLHSLKLRSALRDVRDKAEWVNLFWNEEAENTVRAAHAGDEALPYVVIKGEGFTNPIPDLVRDALTSRDE